MLYNQLIHKKKDLLSLILLTTFPISIISGNLFINIYFILFSINFLLNFNENKILISNKNNKLNLLLIFFFFSLVVNLFFSTDFVNSLPRVVKIILVILFVIDTQRFVLKNQNQINLLFKNWSIIFFIIIVDIFFEYLTGQNLLGFKSAMPGRIASFFGDELVVGAFFHGFLLFFISYLITNYPKKKIFLAIIIIMMLYLSFIIGERSNFLKVFFSLIIFSSLVFKINKINKILILSFIILIISVLMNLNQEYKYRYYGQIKNIYQINGLHYYINNTQYGAHQIVAFEIFKDNPAFGVGIKNFMKESQKNKYKNDNPNNHLRVATHPHQLHMEFLSETGIFGYISFLIFIFSSLILAIRNYLVSKNLYLLSSIIFIFSSLIPIMPSGSFLSTFNSSIFWINFAIMSSFVLKKLNRKS